MNARDYRLWVIVGGVAAVIVLFFLLRPSDDDEAASTTPAATTAPAGTTTVTETETLTETSPGVTVTEEQPTVPEPQAPTIDVSVRNGAPVGGIARATVTQGDPVRIVVRSDVADEVHVHGYDLTADVSPGAPAEITFDATLAGGFEIELEESGVEIAELRVEP